MNVIPIVGNVLRQRGGTNIGVHEQDMLFKGTFITDSPYYLTDMIARDLSYALKAADISADVALTTSNEDGLTVFVKLDNIKSLTLESCKAELSELKKELANLLKK